MKITNTKDMRLFNSLKVLNEIISHTMISRADISVITNLNKGTVSSIVKNLMELNLVSETSIGNSTGGRKPIMLTLNKHIGFCISLEIGVTVIQIIITNLKNEIIQTDTVILQPDSFVDTFQALCLKLDSLILKYSTAKRKLIGIGVCVNGIVDLNGLIRFIPSHNWHNLDLSTLLTERYHVSVFIDNIGNFSVLSEHRLYPEYNDLIALTIDDNISAGIIVNGKLMRGYHGFANSVAHHVLNAAETTLCTCGKKGCWEQYCTDIAIINDVNRHLETPVKDISDFIHLVRNQDKAALQTLGNFVKYMSIGIGNLIFIFNCQTVILNSALIRESPYLVAEISKNIILPITQYQEIMISSMNQYSALLGASDTCIKDYYKSVLYDFSSKN